MNGHPCPHCGETNYVDEGGECIACGEYRGPEANSPIRKIAVVSGNTQEEQAE